MPRPVRPTRVPNRGKEISGSGEGNSAFTEVHWDFLLPVLCLYSSYTNYAITVVVE